MRQKKIGSPKYVYNINIYIKWYVICSYRCRNKPLEEHIVFARLEALVEGRDDIVALVDVNLLQNT